MTLKTVSFSRRRFLQTTAPLLAAPSLAFGQGAPSNRLRVAVIGLSRGISHIHSLSKVTGVEIAAVCDVDSERLAKGVAEAEKASGKKPAAVSDFRNILEDKEIDAVTVALPNFWHTPASVLACQAGKHVYVEKPGSYCARESEMIVEASIKYGRKVQMGNQRRSMESLAEAVQKLREGEIGTLRSARTFYTNSRGSIGKGKPAKVPDHLDYELWQGRRRGVPTRTISSTTTGTGTGIGATANLETTGFTRSISPGGRSVPMSRSPPPATVAATLSTTTKRLRTQPSHPSISAM